MISAVTSDILLEIASWPSCLSTRAQPPKNSQNLLLNSLFPLFLITWSRDTLIPAYLLSPLRSLPSIDPHCFVRPRARFAIF